MKRHKKCRQKPVQKPQTRPLITGLPLRPQKHPKGVRPIMVDLPLNSVKHLPLSEQKRIDYPLLAGKYSYKKIDKGDHIEYHRPTHLKGSGETIYRVNKKNPNIVERWHNPPLTNYTIKYGRNPKWERMPGVNHKKLVDSINKDIEFLNRH